MASPLFATKPVDRLVADTEEESGQLKRAVLTEIVELVNIRTLFAFIITNIGVIVLRRTRPDLERSFRVPLVPWFPLIGAALAIFLMKYLEAATWLRFA